MFMKKGLMYIAATAVLFSTAEIATKTIALQIQPLQLTFLRFFAGGLFLLPFAVADYRRRGMRLTLRDAGFLLMLGFLGITVSMPLFQNAVNMAKAGSVAVVFSTNTIFTALFAVLILRERFTPAAGAAMALGLAGVVCMLNPFGAAPDAGGLALALISAAIFALYGVLGAGQARRYGGVIFNSFTFLTGSLLLLPLMALYHVPVFAGISWSNLPMILYVCLAVTGAGYLFYFAAMRETSAIETSAVFFIKPALAPLLSLFILGEALLWNTLLGILLIVAGAFLLFWGKIKAGAHQNNNLQKSSH
jgi:drug/metabolite transporter (DMT)-like permease